MRKNKLRNKRLAKLEKGKLKDVGFFEGIILKVAGCIDGSRGLPRADVNGRWMSPRIDREIHSYEEFSSRIWGNLQVEEEALYARLGVLIDSVEDIKDQLNTAKAELKEMIEHEKTINVFRKYGEDKLSDFQIKARRDSEKAKRIASFRNHVNSLQNKLVEETEEFSRLYNKILEDNNSTRIICNRVKEHMLQRMNIYWNSALYKHAENIKMPLVPSIEITYYAEELYMRPRISLMKKAKDLSLILAENNKMEVA